MCSLPWSAKCWEQVIRTLAHYCTNHPLQLRRGCISRWELSFVSVPLPFVDHIPMTVWYNTCPLLILPDFSSFTWVLASQTFPKKKKSQRFLPALTKFLSFLRVEISSNTEVIILITVKCTKFIYIPWKSGKDDVGLK